MRLIILILCSVNLALAKAVKTEDRDKCISKAMDKLSKADRGLVEQMHSGKISIAELEKKNYPLAEYEFQVSENCTRNPKWKGSRPE
jgi:hypothetical protein